MAKLVLRDATILYGHLELRGEANELTIGISSEVKETTNYGTGAWRSFIQGLRDDEVSIEGMFDDETVDSRLFTGPSNEPFIATMTNPPADGDIAWALRSMRAQFSLAWQVGEVQAYSMQLRPDSPFSRGVILRAATLTTTGNGATQQRGAVAANQRAFAALSVTAASGTTPTLDAKIQSDDNAGMTSPVDRITFAQKTAIGSEWATVDGAITDDYWRLAATLGGTSPSFTIRAFFGIGTIRY